jgi:hypothetical protein
MGYLSGSEWAKANRPIMWRRRSAIALFVVLFMAANPVFASAFEGRSQGKETSVGSYSGVHVTRTDANFNTPGGSPGCNNYFLQPVVYQSMWLTISADDLSWEELGTADGCNNFDYAYWGYGLNGQWHTVGVGPTPGGTGLHAFEISQDTSNYYKYFIDGVYKGHDAWAVRGKKVWAGLESYADMVIASHDYSGLWYWTAPGTSAQWWSGHDSQQVYPNMCGRFVNDQDWKAGEKTTC